MRDAAVAPVEMEVTTVAHEHLAIVEVVVLDRLRNSVLGKSSAHLLDARYGVDEATVLLSRQSIRTGGEELAEVLR